MTYCKCLLCNTKILHIIVLNLVKKTTDQAASNVLNNSLRVIKRAKLKETGFNVDSDVMLVGSNSTSLLVPVKQLAMPE